MSTSIANDDVNDEQNGENNANNKGDNAGKNVSSEVMGVKLKVTRGRRPSRNGLKGVNSAGLSYRQREIDGDLGRHWGWLSVRWRALRCTE